MRALCSSSACATWPSPPRRCRVGSGVDPRRRPTTDPPAPDRPSLEFAAVERRDLVRNEELDGTVGYGTPTPLAARRHRHPDVPARRSARRSPSGTVVAEVDGEPVIALLGSDPDVARPRTGHRRRRRRAPARDDPRRRSASPRSTTSPSTRLDRAPRPGPSRRSRRPTARTTTARSTSARSCDRPAPVRVDTVGGTLGQAATEAGDRGDRRRPQSCTSTLDVDDAASLADRATRSRSSCRTDRRSPARSATVGAADDRRGRVDHRSRSMSIVDGAAIDIPNGTPVEVLVAVVVGRGRPRRPGGGGARPRRGRLRRRGARRRRARASSASTSARSSTARSRSAATSPRAPRWSCHDAIESDDRPVPRTVHSAEADSSRRRRDP